MAGVRQRDRGATRARKVRTAFTLGDRREGPRPLGDGTAGAQGLDITRMSVGLLPAAVLTLALALAGCASTSHSTTPTSSSASSTPSITAAPATTAPPTSPVSRTTTVPTTAPTLPPTATHVPTCSVSNLRISLAPPLGSAGALYFQLVFENVSSAIARYTGSPACHSSIATAIRSVRRPRRAPTWSGSW